jgi:predicted HicB family RNase H-like nuclease
MAMKRKRPDSPTDARLIHIRLKPETHKRLRVRAAEEDVSIQDWVETLILTGLAAPISDNAPRRNLP